MRARQKSLSCVFLVKDSGHRSIFKNLRGRRARDDYVDLKAGKPVASTEVAAVPRVNNCPSHFTTRKKIVRKAVNSE